MDQRRKNLEERILQIKEFYQLKRFIICSIALTVYALRSSLNAVNGRVQIKAARSVHRAIKHDWLDPQIRTNHTHPLGKHA